MYAIGFHVVTNRCLYLRRLPALLIVIAWLEHDALCEMFDDDLCFSVKVAYPIPGSDDCVRFECLPLHQPHQRWSQLKRVRPQYTHSGCCLWNG